MKIALVTNFIYPEGLGGTELYCYNLAKALLKKNNELFWFVPNWNQSVTECSTFENIQIIRFASVDIHKKSAPAFVAASFIKEMKAREIPVAHFNEFGGPEGISASLLIATKASGIQTIVTLHLLNYLCRQGLMRHVNKKSNVGLLKTYRCGNCLNQSNKSKIASFGMPLLRQYARTHLPLSPALKFKISTDNDELDLVEALKFSADVVVSLTKWFTEVLIANNIPSSSIKYIPQGEPEKFTKIEKHKSDYVFISRIHKEKGIDLLLETARILLKRKVKVNIDIYGPVPVGIVHTQHFLKEIDQLENIHYKGVLPPSEVTTTINLYKAVLLPSIVAEMAPMIIMEANRVQTPVIATDVPGSSELISQYDCGLIGKYNDATDFANKIIEVEKGALQFAFIQPNNTFDVVASRYLDVYRSEKKSNPA